MKAEAWWKSNGEAFTMMFDSVKEKYKNIAFTDEDVLSCALFPLTAVPYLSIQVDEIIEFSLELE